MVHNLENRMPKLIVVGETHQYKTETFFKKAFELQLSSKLYHKLNNKKVFSMRCIEN